MIKVIGLIRRNPELTQEEFVEFWKKVHVPLIKKCIPGLVRYVGNFPIGVTANSGTKASEYDAIIELGFDSISSMEAAMSSPAFQSDERTISSAKLMDLSRTESIVVEEIVIPV